MVTVCIPGTLYDNALHKKVGIMHIHLYVKICNHVALLLLIIKYILVSLIGNYIITQTIVVVMLNYVMIIHSKIPPPKGI